MRITEYNYKRVTIDIEFDEVGEMLNCNEDLLNEFAGWLDKYQRTIEDLKRIDTKRRLNPARLTD